MGDDEATQTLAAFRIPITHRAKGLIGGGGTVRIQKLWLSNGTINNGGPSQRENFN